MVDKAKEKDLVLMEAFHWRYHPFALRCKELAHDLGKIKEISTKLTVPLWLIQIIFKDDIRIDFKLAGGLAMDMGCYAISAMRDFVGEEPSHVLSSKPTKMARPQVDWGMIAKFQFPSGAIGNIAGGGIPGIFSFNLLNLEIVAEKGKLSASGLVAPFLYNKVTVTKNGRSFSEQIYADGHATYFYQLEAFCSQIKNRSEKIIFPPEDAIANMRVLDNVYVATGMKIRGKD